MHVSIKGNITATTMSKTPSEQGRARSSPKSLYISNDLNLLYPQGVGRGERGGRGWFTPPKAHTRALTRQGRGMGKRANGAKRRDRANTGSPLPRPAQHRIYHNQRRRCCYQNPPRILKMIALSSELRGGGGKAVREWGKEEGRRRRRKEGGRTNR